MPSLRDGCDLHDRNVWTISLFSAKLICVEFYPLTSPITIAGDRTARWAKPLHAAKQGPSLGKHAQRSPPNLCLEGYTTFTALRHDKFLRPTGLSDAVPGTLADFYQGLKETGFVQGKNLSIEFRWAGGQYDHLPSLAAELVARNVSVIVAYDVPSAFAAKEATKTIPIVFGSALIRLSWASWIASISLAATSPGCSLY
jgi:hypothetical protein